MFAATEKSFGTMIAVLYKFINGDIDIADLMHQITIKKMLMHIMLSR